MCIRDRYHIPVEVSAHCSVTVSLCGIVFTDIYFVTQKFCAVLCICNQSPECFGIAWASDFWIENADGTTGIREVVSVAQLVKKSAIQKLELSRRYWKQLDVDDWKIVVIDRGGDEVVL